MDESKFETSMHASCTLRFPYIFYDKNKIRSKIADIFIHLVQFHNFFFAHPTRPKKDPSTVSVTLAALAEKLNNSRTPVVDSKNNRQDGANGREFAKRACKTGRRKGAGLSRGAALGSSNVPIKR